MTALTSRDTNTIVNLLYIGESGSGKTGSLVSLVKAGYKLRILDMDNGLDSLVHQIKLQCPEMMKNVDYQSFRDEYKGAAGGGLILKGRATAYIDMLKALEIWDDDSIPSEWGDDTFLVIDSLTAAGRAAYNWAHSLDPAAKDKRQIYFSAQQQIETLIDKVTSTEFNTNVIVCSHITMVETDMGTKGYASSIGSALGPKLAKFFNTMMAAQSTGTGEKVKRSIITRPTSFLDLKVPNEEGVGRVLPLNTGVLDVVKSIKG